MKKNIFCLLIFIFVITACNNDIDVIYKDDIENEMVIGDYTYKFVGQSDNFYFQTGKVYYGENENALLISNFGIKNSFGDDTTYTINLYFNDELLYGEILDTNQTGEYTEEEFKKAVVSEKVMAIKNSNDNNYGEWDSFSKTTKDTFDKSMSLEIKYCADSICKKEKMNIKIIESK